VVPFFLILILFFVHQSNAGAHRNTHTASPRAPRRNTPAPSRPATPDQIPASDQAPVIVPVGASSDINIKDCESEPIRTKVEIEISKLYDLQDDVRLESYVSFFKKEKDMKMRLCIFQSLVTLGIIELNELDAIFTIEKEQRLLRSTQFPIRNIFEPTVLNIIFKDIVLVHIKPIFKQYLFDKLQRSLWRQGPVSLILHPILNPDSIAQLLMEIPQPVKQEIISEISPYQQFWLLGIHCLEYESNPVKRSNYNYRLLTKNIRRFLTDDDPMESRDKTQQARKKKALFFSTVVNGIDTNDIRKTDNPTLISRMQSCILRSMEKRSLMITYSRWIKREPVNEEHRIIISLADASSLLFGVHGRYEGRIRDKKPFKSELEPNTWLSALPFGKILAGVATTNPILAETIAKLYFKDDRVFPYQYFFRKHPSLTYGKVVSMDMSTLLKFGFNPNVKRLNPITLPLTIITQEQPGNDHDHDDDNDVDDATGSTTSSSKSSSRKKPRLTHSAPNFPLAQMAKKSYSTSPSRLQHSSDDVFYKTSKKKKNSSSSSSMNRANSRNSRDKNVKSSTITKSTSSESIDSIGPQSISSFTTEYESKVNSHHTSTCYICDEDCMWLHPRYYETCRICVSSVICKSCRTQCYEKRKDLKRCLSLSPLFSSSSSTESLSDSPSSTPEFNSFPLKCPTCRVKYWTCAPEQHQISLTPEELSIREHRDVD